MLDTTTRIPLASPGEDSAITDTISGRERLLLVIAGSFVLTIYSALIVMRGHPIYDYWHVGVWVACAITGHLMIRHYLPRRDPLLFPVVMLLAGWGMVLTDRLAPAFADRQTVWLVVAVGALLAVVALPGHLRWLSSYRYLWMVGGLCLLALTIVAGTNPSGGGPRLWLGFPDIYFQPAELLKVLLVVFLASYLADHRTLLTLDRVKIGPVRIPSLRILAPLLLMWGLCIVVLLWQQDLGMAALFFIIFLTMLYIASGQPLYVVGGILLLVIAGVVGYRLLPVVRLRVDVWLNPWPQADDRAFQIVQSLLAVSAGGVLGQGVAQGSPTYIPVVHSDFVFAAIAEEWGLLGTLAVTACIALLVLRGMRLAARSALVSPFRSFLATGLSVTLATQSLIIMGGVLKLIPLTGVTLPFLSYGGSSLVVNFLVIGLLLVLSGEG